MLHGFMLFMVINSTIVFGAGVIRWAGVAMFSVLTVAWYFARLRPNRRYC